MTMLRTRWAAIGAVVAISLGAGGVGLVGATTSSGSRDVYTAIPACRLLDTRPTQGIGGRTTPLGPAETYTVQARGDHGQCVGIPGDVTALGLNVTAVGATQLTHITIWPSGSVPNASSLNPSPGEPPTPNAVTTKVAADGSFSIYNNSGSVHVIIDIVGYYRNHVHDDRYYTKAQVDGLVGPRGYGQVRVIGVIPATSFWDMAFSGDHPGFVSARNPGGGVTCLLPDPAVLTPTEVMGGFLQDASGNDTRLYFDGTGFFGCTNAEVVVLQKSNVNGSGTNQSFNVMVP